VADLARSEGRTQLVQSVARGLSLLEALAAEPELGLLELSARCGLRPSTAHRLLTTLIARGYAVQSRPSGRYALGFKLAELAGVLSDRTDRLREAARAQLAAIQRATGESANLSVLVGASAVYIDQVDGTRAVRMSAQLGAAVPAHASAAGKAMLAFAPASAVVDLLGSQTLAAETDSTITSLPELERALATVRELGYAIDDEEHEPGVGCVAAPIFDAHGTAVAALSVSAPIQRIRVGGPARLGSLISEHAGAISRALAGAEDRSRG